VYGIPLPNSYTDLEYKHPPLTKTRVAVALIQETKLCATTKTLTVPNYSLTHNKDRQIPTPTSANTKTKNKAVSGGLISYIKNNIPYANTVSPKMNHNEAQTISIPLTQNKKLTITNMYNVYSTKGNRHHPARLRCQHHFRLNTTSRHTLLPNCG